MPPRTPTRPPAGPARPAPALTPLAQSNAWLTARALHGKTLLPGENSAEAFDKAAEAFWRGGQVEHTFTQANLLLLRMAQAEEHHLAELHATAALRQDVAGLAAQLAGLHKTLDALGRLASGARRDLVTASNEAIELLGAMADAWDSRPEAGPRGRPLVDGGQGEDDGDGDGDDALVEVDSAAPPRRSSRADRQAHEEPGGEGDELIEVDENGNPVEEGQA
ncbi:MAG: hypothetical protein RL071_3298 [Pseudomonadota bacterium]|jgi:hypothetical protein